MSIEEWRAIRGFEGLYEVSNHGRVRGLDRVLSDGRRYPGHVLALKTSKSGHINVRLCKGGAHLWAWVHRLVLDAFVGPAPVGMVCAHNNGIPNDNRPENLRWDTPSGNDADKIIHGTMTIGQRNGNSKLTERDVLLVHEQNRDGRLGRDIASDLGVTPANVSSILRRKTWKHIGAPQ
ncbi:NUMOD4 motif-containing HNH endonuclease [Xanthobacter autotrophicus]|uniref:NUMOD4 motif-containing HNH endonuclease n=1 Tax=Xanthobacter autotrophicus TaxID=280 RepID=UPI003726B3E6